MKRSLFIAILALMTAAFVTDSVFAQSGNYRRYQSSGRNYDPATVETVKGAVSLVETFTGGRRGGGLHLTITTSAGTVRIALGPASFIGGKMSFAKGDAVEVTGSSVKNAQGEKLIIAKVVKKGSTELVLRDAAGNPLWSGQGSSGRGRGRNR